MKRKNIINTIVAILTIVSFFLTAIFGLLTLEDDDFLMGLLIGAPVLVLCINYYIATEFHNIAEKKGFFDMKYFWYCFLLGCLGALMVIALPDRGNSRDI